MRHARGRRGNALEWAQFPANHESANNDGRAHSHNGDDENNEDKSSCCRINLIQRKPDDQQLISERRRNRAEGAFALSLQGEGTIRVALCLPNTVDTERARGDNLRIPSSVKNPRCQISGITHQGNEHARRLSRRAQHALGIVVVVTPVVAVPVVVVAAGSVFIIHLRFDGGLRTLESISQLRVESIGEKRPECKNTHEANHDAGQHQQAGQRHGEPAAKRPRAAALRCALAGRTRRWCC